MAKPDFNRYDYIECVLPTQKQRFKNYTVKVLEKDNLSLLKNPPRPYLSYYKEKPIDHHYVKPCLYDSLFKRDPGYDQRLTQCNRSSLRTAWKTIGIEESKRQVPLRTSSTYGKSRYNINGEPFENHARYNKCREFYVRNDINLKPEFDKIRQFNKDNPL